MAQKTHAARRPDPMGIRDELREYPDDLAAETVAAEIGLPPGRLLVGVALACERALRHAYANLARLAHPKSQAGSASPVLRLRVKEAPGVDSRRLANGALSNLSQFRGCRGGQVQRPRVAPKGCHVLLRQQPPGRTDRRRVHLTLEETAERVLCLDHLSQMRRGVFEGKFILAEAVSFWGRERWQICSHAADLYVLAGFRESSGVEVLHPEPSPSPRAVRGSVAMRVPESGLTVPGPQSPTTLPTTVKATWCGWWNVASSTGSEMGAWEVTVSLYRSSGKMSHL